MHMFEVIARLKNGRTLRGIMNARNSGEIRALVRNCDGGEAVRSLVVARIN